MPFCPNCKSEYDEGYTTCADCDVPLADSLPEAHKIHEQQLRAMRKILLVSTVDSMQTKMAVSALVERDIPVYWDSIPSYGSFVKTYSGLSEMGDDLYVDQGDYDKAVEILNGIAQGMPEDEDVEWVDDPQEPEMDEKYEKRFRSNRSAKSWFSVIVLYGGIVGAVVWLIWWFASGMPLP